jgi:hypothetical protein
VLSCYQWTLTSIYSNVSFVFIAKYSAAKFLTHFFFGRVVFFMPNVCLRYYSGRVTNLFCVARVLASDRPEDLQQRPAIVRFQFSCEGGIEYLHWSPASPKRRRKGNPVPEGPPCSWGIQIRGPSPPGWGSLKNWVNKIWFWVPWDSNTSGIALARTSRNSKLQTRPLVREGATK